MGYKNVTVARITDFADGEMKQVSAEGKEILLARVSGNFIQSRQARLPVESSCQLLSELTT